MNTKNSIIYLLPDKIDVEDIGGTLNCDHILVLLKKILNVINYLEHKI